MKSLIYARHSKKQHSIILQEGLDYAAQNTIGKGEEYTDLFYGPLYRTLQSILVAVATLGIKAKVHEPIEEIGTQEMFEKLATDKFKELVKAGDSNLTALRKSNLELYKEVVETAKCGVQKMFDKISENGKGLACGHSPVIEAAAEAFRDVDLKDYGWQLHECEAIVFVQDDKSNITVKKIIRVQ